jgi:prepilin-type N-terminal cleavage/methylation domain-containing protein
MARRAALTDESGFGLTELLVATAVLGVMMAGVLAVQQQGTLSYLVGSARVEVQQNARNALEVMTTDLRSARAVTAVGAGCDTGPVPTSGGATTVSVTDQDGAAVQYQLVQAELRKNGVAVIGGVQALQIWCFDAANTLTAAAGQVRSVHVRLRTGTEDNVAAYSAQNQHAIAEARVALRNLP